MASTPEPDIAVALRHDRDGQDLPRLVAKGRGRTAARIRAIARERGVPLREDADLARLLAALELDSPIPPAAFAAVAEILAHLYRVNARLGAGAGAASEDAAS
jgi:flagellar biosynthesis protein